MDDNYYMNNQMTTKISNTWWESYREAKKISGRYRQLVSLVDNCEEVAQSMINLEKNKYPDKAESWYLNKIIDELEQQNLVTTLY